MPRNLNAAETDPFTAYVPKHDRRFRFNKLLPLYGSTFTRRVAVAWSQTASTVACGSAYNAAFALRGFLLWLAGEAQKQPDSAPGRLYQALREGLGSAVDAQDLKLVLRDFDTIACDPADTEISSSTDPYRRSLIRVELNRALRLLALANVVPELPSMRRRNLGITHQRLRKKRPSLALLTPAGVLEWEDDETATTEILRHIPDADHAGSLQARLDAVGNLNVRRLAGLRSCAEADLLQEYETFQYGQGLLARDDIPDPSLFKSPEELAAYLAEITSAPTEADTVCLAMVLRVVRDQMGGVLRAVSEVPSCLRIFVASICPHSTRPLTRYLEAGERAFIAAHTIVMTDSGLNLQTCDDLARDPFVGEAVRGKRRVATVAAIKHRARGDSVEASIVDGEADLLIKPIDGQRISGVRAIEIWLEISATIHERAVRQGGEAAKWLWIFPRGKTNAGHIERCRRRSGSLCWWKQFLKAHEDDPLIGGLPITRTMIRPTFNQIIAARNGFDHGMLQAFGGQKDAATACGYVDTPWMRNAFDQHMRAFQELLEVSFAKDIEDVARKLGILPRELLTRCEIALETGIGFICLDPLAGIQPGTQKGERCHRLDLCSKCVLRRFVPTERSLEALYITDKALREREESFCTANVDRWVAVWLPLWALIRVYIEKVSGGFSKLAWQRARRSAEAKLSSGDVSLPSLW